MCAFRMNLAALEEAFGPAAGSLAAMHAMTCQAFCGFVSIRDHALEILPDAAR